MGKVMHPSMGMLSPAADTNLSNDGVVFASVEKLAATLSSMNEIEDPESNIISTSLLSLHNSCTGLDSCCHYTCPADLVGLSSWDAPPLGHPLVVSLMAISNNVSRLPTQIVPSC